MRRGRTRLDTLSACVHVTHMNTHIQIRNVPNALHRKLKARAAQKDMTLTDYVKQLLQREVEKPTLAEMTERLKKLPPVKISGEDIVAAIREERESR
jgi:antitoxin FitA